jgi:hypothetical protein
MTFIVRIQAQMQMAVQMAVQMGSGQANIGSSGKRVPGQFAREA